MKTLPYLLSSRGLLIRRYAYLLRRFARAGLDFGAQRKVFYRAYWAHAAEVVGATISDLGQELFRVTRGERSTLVRYHFIDLDTYFAKSLMDDKGFISDLVRDLGFASPRHTEYTLRTFEVACRFLEEAEGPCVVKPKIGSGGTGITTGITSRQRLAEASLAASNSLTLPVLMIEDQIEGESYRLLYLEGELLHAVRRGKCTVVGDGHSELRRLVALENARRLAAPRLESMSELTIDLEMRYTLADQGLTVRSVPASGAVVRVKNVSNQNCTRDQEVVTDRVHADYHALAASVYERLGARLIGIDVMTPDISGEPGRAGAAVNEINIPPGLHYHEMVLGQEEFTDVGPRILDRLLR